jgi:hypothetical protein
MASAQRKLIGVMRCFAFFVSSPFRKTVLHGIPYEDKMVSRDEHLKIKGTGEALFGQLPVLNVDGTTYGQSYSTAKFVARPGGLHKADPIEALIPPTTSEVSTFYRRGYHYT